MNIIKKALYNNGILDGYRITIEDNSKKIILETGIGGRYQGELGVDSQLYVDACKKAKKEIDWSIVSRDCIKE